ncbi:hypothetical protein GCM10007079_17970 [Nocardiopsis terrae]|nr:hypothetical protein GCM10007079_17970 [Nocardiopsis terrae]
MFLPGPGWGGRGMGWEWGIGAGSSARAFPTDPPFHGDLATRGNFSAEVAPGSKITAVGARSAAGRRRTFRDPLGSGLCGFKQQVGAFWLRGVGVAGVGNPA